MREVRVRSFGELHEEIFAGSWNEALRRHRSSCAFRGMASASGRLESALERTSKEWTTLEAPLLRTFRKYARSLAGVDDSVWHWLAVAQHHGLPTRMLDWSFSPYVALHFMTEDAATYAHDGVVWAIDYVRAKEHLPPRLASILDAEEANVFTTEMLDGAARSLEAFDTIASEPFLAFLEPPALDDRIVNQHALFSLTPRATTTAAWIERHRDLVRRIVVPAALKWEIRDKLDQANVNERVLYPGLDGLSRWLRRYYAPRT